MLAFYYLIDMPIVSVLQVQSVPLSTGSKEILGGHTLQVVYVHHTISEKNVSKLIQIYFLQMWR